MAGKSIAAPAAEQTRACRTCRLILNRFTHPDASVSWEHSRPWVTDHDPDPVGLDQVVVTLVCDFCSAGPPLTSHFVGDPTEAIDYHGRLNRYNDTWAACARCDAYLVAGDIDALADWVYRSQAERGQVVLTDPRPLWAAFLPTITARNLLTAPARLRASQLPKVRDAVVRYWRGRFAVGPAEVRDAVAGGLVDADMFFVSADFTSLAVVAGQKLRPDTELTAEVVPAPAGLLVWDAPVSPMPGRPDGYADTVAVGWTPLLGGGGLHLQSYALASQAFPFMDVDALRAEVGWLAPVQQITEVRFGPLAGATVSAHSMGAEYGAFTDRLLHTLVSTWFLMRQPGVAEERPEAPDKSIRRSYGRSGRRVRDVRVVDLRRRPRRAGAPTGRTWRISYRFMVDGYWRLTHFGPGRSQSEERYVAEYLKGTEDLPFKPPVEKVTRLR